MAGLRLRDDRGLVTHFLLFVVVSAICGVLVAGLAVPFVGTAGIAAKQAAAGFENLPSVLDTPPLPQQSTILAADGTLIATFYSENRIVVPLERVAPVMRLATIAIEDARFYEHKGVDVRGSLRALVTNGQSGGVQQGGSTLTQQYVKNILITTAQTDAEIKAARARTLSRKLREASYAIGLEKRYTKDQILEGYLNIAYFGAGAYGIEAASRRYFSKSAAELTLIEAATLAGIVQQPVGYDPTRNPEASQKRRNTVLLKMYEQGYIKEPEYQAAVATPIAATLKVSQTPNGCASSAIPFFCDYVVNVIRNDASFGATQSARETLLKRGGLVIRTTLDLKAQRAAQAAVEKYIPIGDPSGKAAAIAMVEPGTGAVKAMAQNRHWGTQGDGNTTYNYAVDQAYGGTVGMQAGSTFKAFVLAAAIDQGIPLSETIDAPSQRTFTGFKNCQTGAEFKPYPVKNSTGAGTFDIRSGTAMSVNTFYVALELQTGLCRPAEIAESLGLTSGNGKPLNRYPSFTLGTDTVSPLSMAEAYATFAARGVHCSPRAITSVVDRNGTSLPVPPTDCAQAIDRGVADAVSQVLAGVIDGPLPGRTGAKMSLGRPAAGKTGTTTGNAAVWFIGYTPDLAAAVWAGDPRGGNKYPMSDITINGVHYKDVFGGTIPGPIWKDAMLGALDGVPPTAFPAIDPRRVNGAGVTVPSVAGLQPEAARQALLGVGLTMAVDPQRVSSAWPDGTVAYSVPGEGQSLYSGQTVRVVLSSGPPPVVVPPPPPPAAPAALPSASPVVLVTCQVKPGHHKPPGCH